MRPATGPQDHYATLGVAADASADQVKDAHRALVRQWHPDLWISRGPALSEAAHQELCAVNEAYAVLGDRSSRATYDAFRALQRSEQQQRARQAHLPATVRTTSAVPAQRTAELWDQHRRRLRVAATLVPDVGEAQVAPARPAGDVHVQVHVQVSGPAQPTPAAAAARAPMSESSRLLLEFALLAALLVTLVVVAFELFS